MFLKYLPIFFFLSLFLISCTQPIEETISSTFLENESNYDYVLNTQKSPSPKNLTWYEIKPLELVSFDINKHITMEAYIRPQFDGDDSIKVKNFYAIDDLGNKTLLAGISGSFKSLYNHFPATQVYEIEGVFKRYPSKLLQITNITLAEHSVIEKTVSYNESSCKNTSPAECMDENLCINGEFILAPGFCGCTEGRVYHGGKCVEKESIFPVSQNYTYHFLLSDSTITFEGNAFDRDYFRTLEIQSNSASEYYVEKITNPRQKELLQPFVNDFQGDVLEAVSLVQNIDYDMPGLLYDGLVNKYPYEVLYDNLGVCGDKSFLLIFLLSELGYKTSYIVFEKDNHAAVGIACDVKFSFFETGWCYIETTIPTFITDYDTSFLNYPQDFEIYPISEGKSYDASMVVNDLQEVNDLILTGRKSNDGSITLDELEYSKVKGILTKYGLWD